MWVEAQKRQSGRTLLKFKIYFAKEDLCSLNKSVHTRKEFFRTQPRLKGIYDDRSVRKRKERYKSINSD